MKLWHILIIGLICLIGWINNIIKLSNCNFNKPHKEEIIRIIGIPIVPLGGVVGYININDMPENKD